MIRKNLEDMEIYKSWKIKYNLENYDSWKFWSMCFDDYVTDSISSKLDECFLYMEKNLSFTEDITFYIIPIIMRALNEFKYVEHFNVKRSIDLILLELPDLLEYYKPLRTTFFDDEAESCAVMAEKLVEIETNVVRTEKLKRLI